MDWFLDIWMIISNKLTMMRYNLPSYLLCSRGSRPRDFPILPHRPSWEQSAYTWEQSGQTTNPSGWILLRLRSPKVYNPCGIFLVPILTKITARPWGLPGLATSVRASQDDDDDGDDDGDGDDDDGDDDDFDIFLKP